MKSYRIQYLLLIISAILFDHKVFAQQSVQKTNQLKVYMHYMPWFETPQSAGGWGWHWTMNNKNPNVIIDETTGKRQIASHYYPLIGPYASSDKDVIEYHLLLMKYSGIDGVLIDWYGLKGTNADIQSLLKNSDSIVSYVDDYGLKFGLVLEDRFTSTVDNAKVNIGYARENYFNRPEYIRIGSGNKPLLGVFGPITFQQESQWSQILDEAGEHLNFVTLWNESQDAGANAAGEYMWIYQDQNKSHLDFLKDFYSKRAPQLGTVMAVAYPGFNDFYKEGNSGEGYFYIPHNKGETLKETLSLVSQNRQHIDALQLATWNDFGEGTIFEPTREIGYDYLKQIQKFTGVSYTERELDIIHKLYLLRKEYADDAAIQTQLKEASSMLANLEVEGALEIFRSLDPSYDPPLGLSRMEKDTHNFFRVFPNPANNEQFSIEASNGYTGILSISLFDVTGRLLQTTELRMPTMKATLCTSGLKNGIYSVQLKAGSTLYTKKLIIDK